MKSELLFDEDLSLKTIRIGLIEARDLRWPRAVVVPGTEGSPGGEEAALDPRFAGIVQSVGARGLEAISAPRKSAVRDMLRYGRYKPAGRAKPSSEYLLQAALESDFPAVNFFVDAVNIVSLVSGYPISIVDPGKAGFDFLLRRGREDEK
ncbi:MAG TPA: hypothetical protein VN437_07145, partial [Rectinemataceae bacterium]|nr:hypothetical protein [Rectinemataceae bacterium]